MTNDLSARVSDLERRVWAMEVGDYTPYAQQLIDRFNQMADKVEEMAEEQRRLRNIKQFRLTRGKLVVVVIGTALSFAGGMIAILRFIVDPIRL